MNVLTNTQYTSDISSLYKSSKKMISYHRDKNGFRGDYKKISDIDILVVGGSTTDQRYIDDSQEWCHVLQENMRAAGHPVTVVNAGVDGQSSYGHIKNFDLWFSKIKLLRPKYVLFYVGINDFYKDTDYSNEDMNVKAKSVIKKSFLYYAYRVLKGMALAQSSSISHRAMDFKAIKTTQIPLIDNDQYSVLMSDRLKNYDARLKILIEKTKKIGAIPVFITQPRNIYWMENGHLVGIVDSYKFNGVEYNGVDLYYMNRLINQTTMAQAGESICIDLDNELKFNKDDFYDYAHNTPLGSEKIGRYLAEKMDVIYK